VFAWLPADLVVALRDPDAASQSVDQVVLAAGNNDEA
jgi:hypothetical protein